MYVKAEPTVPDAVSALVITGAGGGATVIYSVALPVPPSLRALIVTGVDTPDKGVPDITPVVAFNVKPAGNVPVV